METPTYHQIETFFVDYFNEFRSSCSDPGTLSRLNRYLDPDMQAEIRRLSRISAPPDVFSCREQYMRFLQEAGQEFVEETTLKEVTVDERKQAVAVVMDIRRVETDTGAIHSLAGYGTYQLSLGPDQELKIRRISLFEC